jgi:hypothetical protein
MIREAADHPCVLNHVILRSGSFGHAVLVRTSMLELFCYIHWWPIVLGEIQRQAFNRH